MNSLGQKIKQLRKSRNMTQAALADGLVTSSMISQIESDRAAPSTNLLVQLAERLGVDFSDFEHDVSTKLDQVQVYRRARSLMEQSNYEDALPLLQSIAFPVAIQLRADLVYGDLADCYLRLNRLRDACEMYDYVLCIAYERDDVPLTVHTYYNLGNVERLQNNSAVACMYWQRAAHVLEQNPDVHMPISLKIHTNLGRLYLLDRSYDRSLCYYERAAELAKQYSSTRELASLYHGLSYVHIERHSLDRALHYNDEAKKLYKSFNHTRGVNQCQIHHAVILRRLGKHSEAVEYLTACIRARTFQQDGIRLAKALTERAKNQLGMNNPTGALDDAKQALVLSKGMVQLQHHIHLLRARAYCLLGIYEQGLTEIEVSHQVAASTGCQTGVEYRQVQRDCLIGLNRHEEALESSLEFATNLVQT